MTSSRKFLLRVCRVSTSSSQPLKPERESEARERKGNGSKGSILCEEALLGTEFPKVVTLAPWDSPCISASSLNHKPHRKLHSGKALASAKIRSLHDRFTHFELCRTLCCHWLLCNRTSTRFSSDYRDDPSCHFVQRQDFSWFGLHNVPLVVCVNLRSITLWIFVSN